MTYHKNGLLKSEIVIFRSIVLSFEIPIDDIQGEIKATLKMMLFQALIEYGCGKRLFRSNAICYCLI